MADKYSMGGSYAPGMYSPSNEISSVSAQNPGLDCLTYVFLGVLAVVVGLGVLAIVL